LSGMLVSWLYAFRSVCPDAVCLIFLIPLENLTDVK
jgi:hypothetical protein